MQCIIVNAPQEPSVINKFTLFCSDRAQQRDDAPFKRRKPHLSQAANATQSQER